MRQSPDIGQNSDEGISHFLISGQSHIKESCQNSTISDDNDMKLGPVTKLDKTNKTTQEDLMLTSSRKIVTSLPFFGFLANLEQSQGQIPDVECAKVMFSVTATFCHTKKENRTKKTSNTALTLLL